MNIAVCNFKTIACVNTGVKICDESKAMFYFKI